MTNLTRSISCRNKRIAYWLSVSSSPMAFHRVYSHLLHFVCVFVLCICYSNGVAYGMGFIVFSFALFKSEWYS